MHNPLSFYFSHNHALALLLPLERTVPGMGNVHGAAAPARGGPPPTRGYPGTLPSAQGNISPHSSSENLTLHRGSMDGAHGRRRLRERPWKQGYNNEQTEA
jgi:hypothetical protein